MYLRSKIFIIAGGIASLLIVPFQNVSAGTINCYGFSSYSTTCYTSGFDSYRPTYYPDYTSSYLLQSQLNLQSELFKLRLQLAQQELAATQRRQAEERQRQLEEIKRRYDQAETVFSGIFKDVFKKDANPTEKNYWVGRIAQENLSETSARDKMNYYKSLGKTMPDVSTGAVKGATTTAGGSADSKAADYIPNDKVPMVVARIFKAIYGRDITVSESIYWKNRARSDKATESKLKGAMAFQKMKGISH